jgi:hypothetical protein
MNGYLNINIFYDTFLHDAENRFWKNNPEAFLWNRTFKSSRRRNKTGLLKPFVKTIWLTVFFSSGEVSLIRVAQNYYIHNITN